MRREHVTWGAPEMTHDTDAFRARYRADISPSYNAWLHGGFVFAYGIAVLAWLITRIDAVRGWEWLAIPAGLVVFNVGEYVVHRGFGHHKTRIGGMFYRRHTGDHHSFFVETKMTFEQMRDWRVIFFPAWLIVLFSIGIAAPAYLAVGHVLGTDAGALFAATLLAGYLTYEIFHAIEHLPPDHGLTRLPWIRHMTQLHRLHHRRELMRDCNFNLVFPLTDWLLGTLYWEPIGSRTPHEPDAPTAERVAP